MPVGNYWRVNRFSRNKKQGTIENIIHIEKEPGS